MSKSAHPHEHPSHEPKKHGCCGGGLLKDEKAQSATQEKVNPTAGSKAEHSHHSAGDPCCCGSGKSSK